MTFRQSHPRRRLKLTGPTADRDVHLAKLFSLVVLFLLLGTLSACNQNRVSQSDSPVKTASTPNIRSSADVVKVTAAPVSLVAGASADATIAVSISPGYHVNANPATFPYLIATQVVPGTAEGITADKPAYPAGEKKKFAFAEEALAVYEGRAEIKLPLRADTKAKGTISLPLNVRVQACDQERCFPPDTLHTTIAVEVK